MVNMNKREYMRKSKEYDFQWLRDMDEEDYNFFAEHGNLHWAELINKVLCNALIKVEEKRRGTQK